MKMKFIYSIIFTLALSTSLISQGFGNDIDNDERRDKIESRIESKKIAFITQKLDLSPQEAQQFWPVYNEYQDKLKDARNRNNQELNEDNLTEKDAENFLDNLLGWEQLEIDLKKEYFNKLKGIVGSKKVARLYILEKEFREELLNNIRSRIGKRNRKMRKGN